MHIYIENLSKEVTEEDLLAAFGEFGKVDSVLLVRSRRTGESIGLGMATMPRQAQVQHAIWALNGKELKGSSATVSRFSSFPAEEHHGNGPWLHDHGSGSGPPQEDRRA